MHLYLERIISTFFLFKYRLTVKLLLSLMLSFIVVIFVIGIMNIVLPIEFGLDDNSSYAQEAISSLSTLCSCSNEEAPKTASEALEKSDMVFIGRVTETLDVPPNKQVIFEVGEIWKGEGIVKRDEVLVFGSEGGCPFDFRISELYLVYASYNNENMLTTSTCDRTAMLSEAQADLDVLGSDSTC